MTFPALNLLLGAALLACASVVHAADTSPATPAADDPLTPARAQIAAKNWTGAIDDFMVAQPHVCARDLLLAQLVWKVRSRTERASSNEKDRPPHESLRRLDERRAPS